MEIYIFLKKMGTATKSGRTCLLAEMLEPLRKEFSLRNKGHPNMNVGMYVCM